MTRRTKEIPRLPLSAFSPSNDTFPIPPTPSLISPRGIIDTHLHVVRDNTDSDGAYSADTSHLIPASKRAVVLSTSGHAPDAIVAALQSLRSNVVDVPVLAVLIPFALDTIHIPEYLSTIGSLALTTTYDGVAPIAADAEGETKDQVQVEGSVKNLHWALRRAQVIDLNIQGSLITIDTSAYDSLVNLLAKAIKPVPDTRRTPLVLTNTLPPPLDTFTPVVTMMNHPTYAIYRQRISSLSLFESVYVKLLPPAWVSTESTASERQEKELRDLLKLFIVPVLEAFGFERIIFGSSPAFTSGSPAPAEKWYRLVLESFRELAVSQDEMDMIFIENAERVYGASQ